MGAGNDITTRWQRSSRKHKRLQRPLWFLHTGKMSPTLLQHFHGTPTSGTPVLMMKDTFVPSVPERTCGTVPFTRAGTSSLPYPKAPSPSSTRRSKRNLRRVSARTGPASSRFTWRMSAPEHNTPERKKTRVNQLRDSSVAGRPLVALLCSASADKVNGKYRGFQQPPGGALDTWVQ